MLETSQEALSALLLSLMLASEFLELMSVLQFLELLLVLKLLEEVPQPSTAWDELKLAFDVVVTIFVETNLLTIL